MMNFRYLMPYDYLKRVFKELPDAQSVEEIEKLLPWEIASKRLNAACTLTRSMISQILRKQKFFVGFALILIWGT